MARNYKNESKWEKENYKRLTVRIPKEISEKFLERLQKDSKSFNEWCLDNVKKYIKN